MSELDTASQLICGAILLLAASPLIWLLMGHRPYSDHIKAESATFYREMSLGGFAGWIAAPTILIAGLLLREIDISLSNISPGWPWVLFHLVVGLLFGAALGAVASLLFHKRKLPSVLGGSISGLGVVIFGTYAFFA